jgi:hypothetical protein
MLNNSAEACLDVAPLHFDVDSQKPWNRHARSELLLRDDENAVAGGTRMSAHVSLL